MRQFGVVELSPGFDDDAGFTQRAEPFAAQHGFEQHNVVEANERYNQVELQFARRSDVDVVLVSEN